MPPSEAESLVPQPVSGTRTLPDAGFHFLEEKEERREEEEDTRKDRASASVPSGAPGGESEATQTQKQPAEQWDSGTLNSGINSGDESESQRKPDETSQHRGTASSTLGSEPKPVPPTNGSCYPTLDQYAKDPLSQNSEDSPAVVWYPAPLPEKEVWRFMRDTLPDSMMSRVEAELLECVETEPGFLTPEQKAIQIHCLAAYSMARAGTIPVYGLECSMTSHLGLS